MKIGIFLDHLRDASLQTGKPLEFIAKEAVAAGFEFIHVNGEFWMANEERIDQFLQNTGLTIGSVDLLCQLTQGKDTDKAENLIRFMSRKGVEQLLLIPGFVHEAQSRKAAMEQAALHMKQLLYLARGLHVKCSLEDYDNQKAPFGTWQELKWFVERLPDLGVCFDTGNFAFFGQDAIVAYDQLEPYICFVHAKDRKYIGRDGEESLLTVDGKRLYPSATGSGEMPISEIVSRLKAKKFDAGIIVEHFGSADMYEDMCQSVRWLKGQLST